MTPYALHPAFYNQPIRLLPEEVAAPQQVLQEFFESFELADTRRLLWLAVEAALSLPHSPFDVAEERQSLLWLYHQLERMLEAGMLLGQADGNSITGETDQPRPMKNTYYRRSKSTPEPPGYRESLMRSRF